MVSITRGWHGGLIQTARCPTRAVTFIAGCSMLFGFQATAFGDTLSVESASEKYELFEPIVLGIELTLDKAPDAMRFSDRTFRRKISTRLDAELWAGDRKVASAILGGGGFGDLEPGRATYKAITIGLLGNLIPGQNQSEFEFWDAPGVYSIIVVDQERNIQSEAISVSIIPPEDIQAARLFASGRLNVLLSLQSVEHVDKASDLFQQLLETSPNSVFGKYARMLVAIGQFEQRRMHAGGAPKTRQSGRAELEEALNLFSKAHPLRSRALLRLAEVDAMRADGNSGLGVETLKSQTQDGLYRVEALQLEQLIQRRSREVEPDVQKIAP